MPVEWARIKAILFDIDGTLSDTDNHLVARIVKPMSVLRGIIPPEKQKKLARGLVMFAETPGNFLYHQADHLGIDALMFRLSEWISRHALPQRRRHFWIIPGVKGMLKHLASRYPMAVVSARDREGTDAFLDQFKLGGYFQAVASSQTCRHTKPFPDPLLWAAERLGVNPGQCLMVGDTVVDMRAGRLAGAQTAGVLCGFGTQRELEKAGADLILKKTPDLMDWLGSD